MTYANDCIQERRRGLKSIFQQSDAELDAAIARVAVKQGEEFWQLLHAIDAYQERRRRIIKRAQLRYGYGGRP